MWPHIQYMYHSVYSLLLRVRSVCSVYCSIATFNCLFHNFTCVQHFFANLLNMYLQFTGEVLGYPVLYNCACTGKSLDTYITKLTTPVCLAEGSFIFNVVVSLVSESSVHLLVCQ